MASLDYTNIAGSPFQPYVDTQIEKRRKLVNKDYRNSSELQWLTNRNAWIRVSSGANVIYGNKKYGGLEGDALSKKYILQAGLVDHTDGAQSFNLRSGISPDGAYGIGGSNSFGLKPMPGITGMSIGTGGKLGTLKEITIDFICYNMEQLNIMEALYMKLGFGLLVEWGHTIYINNDTENIETIPIPLPFYGIKTKEELLEKITINRKNSFGNYDASWSTIKNFSYSLSDNGSFKCQVKLVGAGDILESLKINVSGDFTVAEELGVNVNTSSIYPVVSDKNQSLLNNALYNIYYKDVLQGDNVKFQIDSSNEYLTSIEPFLKNLNYGLGDNFGKNSELKRKGYHYRLINESGIRGNTGGDLDSNVLPIETPSLFFGRLVMGYEINGETLNSNDISTKGLEQVYITLGHLLLLINSNGMLFQKNTGGDQTSQNPYVYIDVNPDTNRCYTFPGHCSLDPTVCLIGSSTLPFGITSQAFEDIKSNFNWFDNDGTGGRFMWTLVNIDWVTSLMKHWRTSDKKGNIYFIDLVKDILDGISKATGGYNEFRVVPDDDSRCVRILDDRRVSSQTQIVPTYTQIPVLGKKSLAYNFSYSSKIAPNMAAMIVIAAQAQPYGVQGAENALSFSHLNKGLYNRLDTITVDSGTDSNSSLNTSDDNIQRYVEARDFIENIYDGLGTGARSTSKKENQASEKALGVKGKANVKEIPINQVKALILLRLNLVYDDLREGSKGLKNEGELEALQKAYNNTITEINSKSDEDLSKSLGNFLIENNKVFYLDIGVYNIVHDKLESNYKSQGYITDTKIEAIWTDIASKQTGISRSWY
jgi:hypothetical protein